MRCTTLVPLIGVLLLTSGNAMALADEQNREFKCHVSYTTGGDGIHFIETSERDMQLIKDSLVGNEVNKLDQRHSKVIVYKVMECVALEQTFAGARARQLDNLKPR